MPNVTPLRPGDPRRVGRYRLTGRVDDFAAEVVARQDVFLAQRVDGETVMAAFPGTGRADDAAAQDRFVAEARVARNIPPFCVARIRDAGVVGSQPYLITEFVPGPLLAEVVHREGPLPTAEIRALAVGCATGIASIHQAGLVHGQFGPDMVVIGREGPRVVHFSTTPPYGAATPAADILAWARVVAFAATGHLHVSAEDLTALPDDLRPVVADCLSPDPVARPHARALLTELLSGEDLSAGLLAAGARRSRMATRAPAPVPPVPGEEPQPRGGRSRAALWAAACLACIVAIAAAVFFITGRHPGTGTPAPTRDSATGGSLAEANLPIPRQVNGTWSGTIHQTKPSISVAVKVTLPGGSTRGTLAYPQIGCTGRLGLVSARHSVLTFRLTITSGQKNCVPGMVKLAVRSQHTLTFTFMRRGGSNPVGNLTRQP
jgi:eukaryotic-like serine/threonine-protein kinase